VQRSVAAEAAINDLIAGVFTSAAGREALQYLRSITIELINGPGVSTDALRHLEGQRFIVGVIESRIRADERAKRGKK